jgi:hypothetical protein
MRLFTDSLSAALLPAAAALAQMSSKVFRNHFIIREIT